MEARKDVNDGAALPERAVLADRRRPGRSKAVNPDLIRLLRTSELKADAAHLSQDDDGNEPDAHDADGLSAARGIVWGLAFSVPAWVGAVALGAWLLR